MNSRTTFSFWKAFDALPPNVQQRAKEAYQLWRENPDLPGLRFKRVGTKYRFASGVTTELWASCKAIPYTGTGLVSTINIIA